MESVFVPAFVVDRKRCLYEYYCNHLIVRRAFISLHEKSHLNQSDRKFVYINVNSKLIRLSEMMVFSGVVIVCSTSLFFDLFFSFSLLCSER